MKSPLRKGCGPKNLGSPLKMDPITGMIVGKVVGKVVDKALDKSPMKKQGPCWSNYEMVGMKTKGGRKVPNCVPRKK
jgi:hypothetical protein